MNYPLHEGDLTMKKLDWLDRSLRNLERHASRKATTESFDKRKKELHDRASRKIRLYIKKRWSEEAVRQSQDIHEAEQLRLF